MPNRFSYYLVMKNLISTDHLLITKLLLPIAPKLIAAGAPRLKNGSCRIPISNKNEDFKV